MTDSYYAYEMGRQVVEKMVPLSVNVTQFLLWGLAVVAGLLAWDFVKEDQKKGGG